MASKAGEITLRGRFLDGTKVSVFARVGDFFPERSLAALGDELASGTPKDGELTLSDLVPGGTYWAVQRVDGEVSVRQVRFTAHAKDRSDTPVGPPVEVAGPLVGQTHPPGGSPVTGPRNTKNVRPGLSAEQLQRIKDSANPRAHEVSGDVAGEVERQPARKVADAHGETLRSDTPMGTAFPTEAGERQPDVPQSEAEGPQRSDTELGTAAPVEKDEVQPSARQEDSDGVVQRSDTATGGQEAVPGVKASKPKAKPKRRAAPKRKAARKAPTKVKASSKRAKR